MHIERMNEHMGTILAAYNVDYIYIQYWEVPYNNNNGIIYTNILL